MAEILPHWFCDTQKEEEKQFIFENVFLRLVIQNKYKKPRIRFVPTNMLFHFIKPRFISGSLTHVALP